MLKKNQDLKLLEIKIYSIDESMSIDGSKHSPFGVSKTSEFNGSRVW